MKLIHLFFLASILIFPAFSRAERHAEHQYSEHNHAEAIHEKLTLNDGKKWRTDETLRHAMKNIHASVTSALPDIQSSKLSPTQYDALGKEIAEQLSLIVQNCKLDPKADLQLHLIIASIADGIDTATAKKSTQKRALGIHKITESLNNYGKYFDHPDWQTLKLSQH